jgi:hypothetical protein
MGIGPAEPLDLKSTAEIRFRKRARADARRALTGGLGVPATGGRSNGPGPAQSAGEGSGSGRMDLHRTVEVRSVLIKS